MYNPGRTPMLLSLVLVVVASGCGSTKTASTSKTASVGAGTSAPANQGPQTSHPGTGSTGGQASTTPSGTATNATPNHPAKGTTTSAKAAKPNGGASEHLAAPPRYLYPAELTQSFISVCTAASNSTSSCECLVGKYEAMNVQEGESLSFLVGLEITLKHHLKKVGVRAKRFASECHATIVPRR
jgi:hypothetical protein